MILIVWQFLKFSCFVTMLTCRIPVQYIIGEWEFRNLTLTMRPSVFIPGPWTEVCNTTPCYPFSISHAMEAVESSHHPASFSFCE